MFPTGRVVKGAHNLRPRVRTPVRGSVFDPFSVNKKLSVDLRFRVFYDVAQCSDEVD
jgi:hypothetical protein